jgi:hypothetical protein
LELKLNFQMQNEIWNLKKEKHKFNQIKLNFQMQNEIWNLKKRKTQV